MHPLYEQRYLLPHLMYEKGKEKGATRALGSNKLCSQKVFELRAMPFLARTEELLV